MNILCLDTEVTGATNNTKGNPFTRSNRLVYCGIWDHRGYSDFPIEYDSRPYGRQTREISSRILECDLLVGFNLKFDLHWLRRYGITEFQEKRIWDCQTFEYLVSRQTMAYPSLGGSCEARGLGSKIDIIKTEYWERRCSCYVSIVERLKQFMQESYAVPVIIDCMNKGIGLQEILEKSNGRKIIQSVIELISSARNRDYVLTLKQRLGLEEQRQKDDTISQIKSMIYSWQKQSVEFAERYQSRYVSTIATKPGELEACCAEHVMRLWDTLRRNPGWFEHHPTCNPIPLDTDSVPEETLKEYLASDVTLTHSLYLAQRKIYETFPQGLQTLIRLSNQDLLVLQECEWNGLPYNLEASSEESRKLEYQILGIEQELNTILGVDFINWNSGYHISTILYGGIISIPSREVYTFQYKDGRTKEKERPSRNEYIFPALVEPLKGSELAKEGYYSTDESTLRKLRGGKQLERIVELLLQQAKLEKLKGTYFDGFPKLHSQMDWEPNILHGQLNQPVTTTGRLSSNKPNQQNVPDPVRGIIESRYA